MSSIGKKVIVLLLFYHHAETRFDILIDKEKIFFGTLFQWLSTEPQYLTTPLNCIQLCTMVI